MKRRFWPAGEAAQVDYERLRTAALAGTPLIGLPAARFARAGLAALIARPVAEPGFVAVVAGAARRAWTPQGDPRKHALAAGFQLVLAAGSDNDDTLEVAW